MVGFEIHGYSLLDINYSDDFLPDIRASDNESNTIGLVKADAHVGTCDR